MRLFRRRRDQPPEPQPRPPASGPAAAAGTRGFGYKCSWLAVGAQVAGALELQDVAPAQWTQGVPVTRSQVDGNLAINARRPPQAT